MVIGPAIRRSISEALRALLQNLNRTLDQSFSLKGLSWRIEAWRTGVPFHQILLRNTLIYRVEQVFLIHRDSGLLIQHLAQADVEIVARPQLSIVAFRLKPEGLENVEDSTIAILGALLLFVIPVNLKRREFLLDWQTAVKIPWDIIVLFGGGFALAQGFSDSGLTSWLAGQLSVLQGVSMVLIITAVVLLVIYLTELTSNTATASLILPVMGALAAAIGVHPFGLMVAAAVASSFAFMLPVATAPNAVIYGSGRLTVKDMARAGLVLNLFGAIVISIVTYLFFA